MTAEIQIRAECEVSGLVRLGDVAEIHTHDADELARLKAIELFPAPATGNKSFVRAREVQDLLALRGLNLSRHRLTGASQIEIHNGSKSASPVSSSAALRAAQRAEAAIAACLRRRAGKDGGWKVEAPLDDELVRAIGATKDDITAEGGQEPFVGEQQFSLMVPGGSGERQFSVTAKIKAVPLVVVATRALVPGDVVQQTDVKLAQAKDDSKDILFHALDEVVGQQARRALVEGQPIKQDDLQSPLLVRQNDAVHVYARGAGIQVTTRGRAQENGSRGDVILVESMLNRERFMARVSGIQEVEVYTQAADADAATNTVERSARSLKPAHRQTVLAKGARTGPGSGLRITNQPAPRQATLPDEDTKTITADRR